MIRTFVVVGAMLAAGPVWAEMAKAPAKPKPPKMVTVSGCTSSGYAGCTLLKAGKDTVLLKANAGAMTHSRNVSASARAVAVSTGRLTATTPPNAETSSARRAAR